jgi:hypothetical protein
MDYYTITPAMIRFKLMTGNFWYFNFNFALLLDSRLRDCVAITFLSFRASEARHGIQYL